MRWGEGRRMSVAVGVFWCVFGFAKFKIIVGKVRALCLSVVEREY